MLLGRVQRYNEASSTEVSSSAMKKSEALRYSRRDTNAKIREDSVRRRFLVFITDPI